MFVKVASWRAPLLKSASASAAMRTSRTSAVRCASASRRTAAASDAPARVAVRSRASCRLRAALSCPAYFVSRPASGRVIERAAR